MGTDEIWSLAEGALQQALQQKGWEYQVCSRKLYWLDLTSCS